MLTDLLEKGVLMRFFLLLKELEHVSLQDVDGSSFVGLRNLNRLPLNHHGKVFGANEKLSLIIKIKESFKRTFLRVLKLEFLEINSFRK